MWQVSVASGEQTFRQGTIISDTDIFIITKKWNPIFQLRLARLVNKITCDLDFKVTVGIIKIKDLKKNKDLEFYEAMKIGSVLWGNKDVFQNVPIKTEKEIPKWEGIRLLLNRAIDLTEALYGQDDSTYIIAKSYLAIAQAYLILNSRYRTSYKERLMEIQKKCDLTIFDNALEKIKLSTLYKTNQINALSLSKDEAREDFLKALGFFLSRPTLGC